MKLNIKGWKRELQQVVIADRTKYTLKNGRVVLSTSNMERQLRKMIS
jgi:hypothetical protein